MRAVSLLVAAAGVAGIVFGSVWATAVFPGLKRIPDDYDQTVDFEGTYAVLANQDFLLQLLGNQTIQQTVGNPQTLLLLASPQTAQFLPELAGNQAIQQALGSPQTLQLLASAVTAELLGSEALRGLLANPALLQQILANPAAAAQVPDPAARQLLVNPTVQALLRDPGVQRILAETAALRLVLDRRFQALLADAGVRRLLADRAALALMLDPRTQRLLASRGAPDLQQVPVAFHRVRKAEKVEGDKLFIHQDFDATGQTPPQLSSKSTLVVHRKTREYLPGGTEARRGLFSFPFDVSRDETYSLWVTEVYQPLQTSYAGEGEVAGLKVYDFRVAQRGVPVPDEAKKDLGLPASLDLRADVDILFKVEPKSGIPVALDSDIAYRLQNPVLGNPVVFRAQIRDTAASVRESVADARDARRLLYWLGRVLPHSAIGLGLVLVVGANFLWPARKSNG